MCCKRERYERTLTKQDIYNFQRGSNLTSTLLGSSKTLGWLNVFGIVAPHVGGVLILMRVKKKKKKTDKGGTSVSRSFFARSVP